MYSGACLACWKPGSCPTSQRPGFKSAGNTLALIDRAVKLSSFQVTTVSASESPTSRTRDRLDIKLQFTLRGIRNRVECCSARIVLGVISLTTSHVLCSIPQTGCREEERWFQIKGTSWCIVLCTAMTGHNRIVQVPSSRLNRTPRQASCRQQYYIRGTRTTESAKNVIIVVCLSVKIEPSCITDKPTNWYRTLFTTTTARGTDV